jgi:ribosomal protein S18 acetylase RimI-like enzyme
MGDTLKGVPLTAYRFCRTDDIGLLVEAHEHCRGPEDAAAPALDRARFKELVREIDLWCSSCMVALEGREPVGVLLGAKRDAATLVYAVRVHPQHRRRGHGRHLLTSLGQKLAILGPPRLVAEVPADRAPARALFTACAWRDEARLVDWRHVGSGAAEAPPGELAAAPIAVAEAIASGLLHDRSRSWRRELAALARRGESLIGLGFHSHERLEACLIASDAGASAGTARGWSILAAGVAPGDVGRLGLRLLVAELDRRAGGAPLELPRTAPDEIDAELLVELGFRSGAEHRLFATEARAA